MKESTFAEVVAAKRYLSRNSLLNRFRNYMGAHIDPEKIVQSSIRYHEPDLISTIGFKYTDTDFGLQLDFATDVLEGAIASNLPRGRDCFPEELSNFFEVLTEAYEHVKKATYILTHVFLWDRFGIG